MSLNLYIKSLQLENFRGFKELSIPKLHPRLNVFLGNNGAGKSSILEAIGLLLGQITGKLGNNSVVKTTISYDDVYHGAKSSSITAYLFDKQPILMAAQAVPAIKDGKKSSTCNVYTQETIQYIQSLEKQILFPDASSKIPVFISYKATRTPDGYISQNYQVPEDSDIQECYNDAISMNPSFGNFFEWFKHKEDIENQVKISMKDFNYIDRELQVVRDAMQKCLGFDTFSIDRKYGTFNLRKKNQELYFTQLSDGEKCYLLLVADIARRLAIANPYTHEPLAGGGIVLIDEIELHLHPKWQRQIIPQLLATFTSCQFIITTHSPQVIGEVAAESIWILEDDEQPYHPERSYGMDSSELLREIMDAPSANKDVTVKLEKIEQLIDDEKYSEARTNIEQLAHKTGKIPSLIGVNSLLTMYGEEEADLGE